MSNQNITQIASNTEANSSHFLPVKPLPSEQLIEDIRDACIELRMCRQHKFVTLSDEEYVVRAYEQTIRARKLMNQFLKLTDPNDTGPDPMKLSKAVAEDRLTEDEEEN